MPLTIISTWFPRVATRSACPARRLGSAFTTIMAPDCAMRERKFSHAAGGRDRAAIWFKPGERWGDHGAALPGSADPAVAEFVRREEDRRGEEQKNPREAGGSHAPLGLSSGPRASEWP